MSRAFRRANQVFSALMVVVGIVLVWSSRADGAGMTVFWALGVILIVYGVVRYVAWSRYRGREED